MTEDIKITITYKYFLKSTRANISKSQYFHKRQVLLRGINSPIMFVRAPKHFKTGKQHIVLFNGKFLRVHHLRVTPSSSEFFFSHPVVILSSLNSLREFSFTDTVVSRTSIQSTAVINLTLNGRCSFFSTNR